MENKNFCVVMELSIIQFSILALLFAYQIWFVWKQSYGYRFRSEPRLWIMLGCLVFCLRKCIFFQSQLTFFLHSVNIGFNLLKGPAKWLTWSFTEMCFYQVFVATFMVLFSKIMNILPLIKKKWMARLKLMHLIFSLALTLLGVTTALLPAIDNNSENFCSRLSFISEQVVFLISCSILLFLRKKIENKVESLAIISDLDLKIRWSYNRLLSQLKCILLFILGFQCFKILYHLIVY